MPQVHVYGMGGTIAVDDRDGLTSRTATEMVGSAGVRMPAVARTTSFRQVSSANVGLADLVALAADVMLTVPDGDAVVVTQGTDTLEESAFALDLLLAAQRAVVLTGAMRSGEVLGADGGRNVADAIRVAADGRMGELGAVVVFDGAIHAAPFVFKAHAQTLAPFVSTAGPIGWVLENRVEIVMRPVRGISIAPDEVTSIPPVGIVRIGAGDDGRILRAAADAGCAALVVEGVGGGHVPAALAPLIGDLAQRLPVVLARGTPGGSTMSATYRYPGSETDLLARGVLGSGWLSARKARVLLGLVLAGGGDRTAMISALAAYGGTAGTPSLDHRSNTDRRI